MKKIYQKPLSSAVELETSAMLAASLKVGVTEDEVNAADSYSNKMEQHTSGPWSGKLWDEME